MPQWKILQPNTPDQWENYYQLRFSVLRKPWNQDPGTEHANDDHSAFHGAIFGEDGKALAVARVSQISEQQAQIRFMAVDPKYQGKGLGKAVLKYVENLGMRNYPTITQFCLQARETAVPFYLSNNYRIQEKTFLLFDEIQHYLMVKDVHPKTEDQEDN
jgi:predicted GNAT family N-acyltransferase